MIKSSTPATAKEIIEMEQLLRKGRNRYDNALLEIEKVWGKLKPYDYSRRTFVVKTALHMAEIDQSLKVWEQKLSSE